MIRQPREKGEDGGRQRKDYGDPELAARFKEGRIEKKKYILFRISRGGRDWGEKKSIRHSRSRGRRQSRKSLHTARATVLEGRTRKKNVAHGMDDKDHGGRPPGGKEKGSDVAGIEKMKKGGKVQ